MSITGFILLLLFSGLLFIKRNYARLTAGALVLFLSCYFFLALLDALADIHAAGGEPSDTYRLAGWLIGGSFCMSILLIIPLHLPRRVPLYNRK